MDYIFQISLKSVLTLENGMKEEVKGENLLSFTLVYPREGVKSLETIKKLPLQRGKEYALDQISFSDKLLFKESIQGDSALQVSLTAIERPQKIDHMINDAIKAGVMAGTGFITGGTGITLLMAATKTVVGSLFDLAKPKDKVTVIGNIDFPMNNQLREGELILNLTVPRKTVLKDKKIKNGKEIISTTTLKKGFGVAKLVLDVKKIPRFNIAIPAIV